MPSGKAEESSDDKKTIFQDRVRPSILLRLVRHAESRNNEVYRNARYIYRGGTPDFDEAGWLNYVNANRSADPSLSTTGKIQADKLADFLVPHLEHQASRPVRIITSPMRRTLETIRPTIQRLQKLPSSSSPCNILVNGFYFESEGCHTKDKPEPGMSPDEIKQVLNERNDEDDDGSSSSPLDISFTGFPDPHKGWWCDGKGAETRSESEARAAKFYLWLCEHLDQQLAEHNVMEDLFDAGVAVPGEENENEHDKLAPRQRRRRMAFLIGHADFMSLVLKRIIAGFGHFVETEGVAHRSAMIHVNTGITELEYFGHGRFLVMSSNQTPHFSFDDYSTLRTGGSLKDGWSYIVPEDEFVLDAEVTVAFSDEDLEGHVREQAEALKALYLSSKDSTKLNEIDRSLSVEKSDSEEDEQKKESKKNTKHFIVKRGLQVVGVATYHENTGRLVDVAVRPSAGKEVGETLFNAVREHSRRMGRSGSLLVMPRCDESKQLFENIGFEEVTDREDDDVVLSF